MESASSSRKRPRENESESQRVKREKAAARQRKKREKDRNQAGMGLMAFAHDEQDQQQQQQQQELHHHHQQHHHQQHLQQHPDQLSLPPSPGSMSVSVSAYQQQQQQVQEPPPLTPDEQARRDRVRAAARIRQRKHRLMVKQRKMRELGLDMGNEIIPGMEEVHYRAAADGQYHQVMPHELQQQQQQGGQGPQGQHMQQQQQIEPPFPQGAVLGGQTFASTLLLSFSCAPLLKQHLLRTLAMSNEELTSLEPIIAEAWDRWDHQVLFFFLSPSQANLIYLRSAASTTQNKQQKVTPKVSPAAPLPSLFLSPWTCPSTPHPSPTLTAPGPPTPTPTTFGHGSRGVWLARSPFGMEMLREGGRLRRRVRLRARRTRLIRTLRRRVLMGVRKRRGFEWLVVWLVML